MMTKALWLLIAMFSTIPFAFAAPEPLQLNDPGAFENTGAVRVLFDFVFPGTVHYPLTEHSLRDDIEDALEKKGISVASATQHLTSGGAVLKLSVSSRAGRDPNRLFYTASVEFSQPAELLSTHRRAQVVTWRNVHCGECLASDLGVIREVLRSLADELISDYRFGNHKPAQRQENDRDPQP